MEPFLILLIGLCMGSFVTLASYRLPLGEDIICKSSRCPACGARLRMRDLWPVLSWAMAGGKCARCKAPVSIRYPLTELATAAGFMVVYFLHGLSPLFFVLALLWVMLMIMIVVDFEHTIIPDLVHYILFPLAFVWHYLRGNSVEDALWGLALGGGIALSLHYGYKILRGRDGLGFGDVKFLAAAGVWLGVKPLMPFLFISGLLGVVTGLTWRALGKGPVFPFGPSLALSLFLCVAFDKIGNLFWYIAGFVK